MPTQRSKTTPPISRLAPYVIAAVLVAALSGYWFSLSSLHERMRRDALESALQHTQRHSDAMSANVDILFGSVDSALMRIRERYLTEGKPALESSARAAIAGFPDGFILQIGLIGPDGNLAFSSFGRFDRIFLGDREHFRVHAESGQDAVFVSQPLLTRTSNKWAIQFSRSVRANGRLVGVLVASMNPGYIARSLVHLQVHPDDNISLLAENGSFLARVPYHEQSLGTNVPADRPFIGKDAPTRGSYQSVSSLDQESRLASWSRVPRYPLVVVSDVTRRSALAPAERVISRSLRDNLIGSLFYLLLSASLIALLIRARRSNVDLAGSEERIRSIIDTSPDAVISLDEEGRIILFNRAAETMFGHATEDMLGYPLDDLIPERYRGSHDEHLAAFSLEATASRPMVRTNQVVGLRKDGSEFPIEVTISKSIVNGILLYVAVVHDITARLTAEESRRRSEQRFRDLVNCTDGIVWEAEARSFRFTFVSDQAERLLGFPAEEWLRPGFWLDHLHPDDRICGTEYCLSRTRSGHPNELEYRFIARNGETVWLRESFSVVSENGEPKWLRGLMVDITGQKKAEEDLRTAETRWRFALEGSGQGVWDWDVEKDSVTYSRLWKEALGYVDEEISSRFEEWEDRLHPDDREGALSAIQAHLRGATKSFFSEHRLRHKNGSYRWILGRGMAVDRDAAGRALRVVGTLSDITPQKDLAEALRNETQRTREIIQSAREGIIVYGPDLRYQVWNPFMEGLTGLPEAEVLGRKPLEVFPFLKDGGVIERLERALRGEFPEPVEFSFDVQRSGFKGWASDQCAPLRDADGEIVGVIGTVHLITRVKEAEVTLRRMNEELEARVDARTLALRDAVQRAESASHAKSAFLAKMSHEMRTPMTAILGMTELLKRDTLTSRVAERIKAIDDAAEHLLGIINDLLDVARIEAGKMIMASDELTPAALIEESVGLIRERAQSKGLEIRSEISTPAGPLLGDRKRLRQCLINYLSNAVKFTERGSIAVRVLPDDQPARSPGFLRLRFEVTDTGIGIEPAAMARLFNSFEQVDNSMTRERGGTGLGLAIVRQLARMMGGDAGASSVAGQGSTFWFTCELAVPGEPLPGLTAAPGHDEKPANLPRLPGRRILIVDDEPANLSVVSSALELLGVTTESCGDGDQAIQRIAEAHFDLVLMDLHLPRLSGLAATTEIRRRFPESKIPIIALTGDSPDAVSELCRNAGMNGVIGKPFHIDTLLDRVVKALETPASGQPWMLFGPGHSSPG